MTQPSIPRSLKLRAGEWVQVRSREEILSTLDMKGQLDLLPFMPQMFQYCGQTLRVSKRAHKLCDTAFATGGRKMSNAVHLETLRCDGAAYGGCELRCLLYFKEAWLKRVTGPSGSAAAAPPAAEPAPAAVGPAAAGCTETDVWAGTQAPRDASAPDEPVYVCQATQLPVASQLLPRWSLSQYIQDYTSGNVSLGQWFATLLFAGYYIITEAGLGMGSALRWFYDAFQKLRGGSPYPWRRGLLPKGVRTPSEKLNLQLGERVRIKDHREILKTLDEGWNNRGMTFHGEMVPYCGKTYRVAQRVGRIMNEKTGKIMTLKNECLVLEGVDCLGRYTKPLFCPRACYPYWREIWLERADQPPNQDAAPPSGAGAV